MSKTFFRLPTWAQIWFLLPGQEAQMVGTNWGEGQSLYVLLKSRASPEVEGAIAVAQASSGWWERWQPSRVCLLIVMQSWMPVAAVYRACLWTNSSIPPSDSANRTVCVCMEESYSEPCSSPGRCRSSIWCSHQLCCARALLCWLPFRGLAFYQCRCK